MKAKKELDVPIKEIDISLSKEMLDYLNFLKYIEDKKREWFLKAFYIPADKFGKIKS